MKKDFLKIVAFVLLSTFAFQNCDPAKDAITELTPDNITNVINRGLYGKVKTMTETNYSATWDAVKKEPVVPTNFNSRSTTNYNEQGFQTASKRETFITVYTISTDKKSATAAKQPSTESEDVSTFDAQNRLLTEVSTYSYSSSVSVKIKDGTTERTVDIYDYRYFDFTQDDSGNITKIAVKTTDYPNVTIESFDYGTPNKTTTTYVYDDVARTGKMTEVNKTSYSQDSTVATFKLLANGKIDQQNVESITYKPKISAYTPVTQNKNVTTKDDKGNVTLYYTVRTPYFADGVTLDETKTSVGSYRKTEYQYW